MWKVLSSVTITELNCSGVTLSDEIALRWNGQRNECVPTISWQGVYLRGLHDGGSVVQETKENNTRLPVYTVLVFDAYNLYVHTHRTL